MNKTLHKYFSLASMALLSPIYRNVYDDGVRLFREPKKRFERLPSSYSLNKFIIKGVEIEAQNKKMALKIYERKYKK